MEIPEVGVPTARVFEVNGNFLIGEVDDGDQNPTFFLLKNVLMITPVQGGFQMFPLAAGAVDFEHVKVRRDRVGFEAPADKQALAGYLNVVKQIRLSKSGLVLADGR